MKDISITITMVPVSILLTNNYFQHSSASIRMSLRLIQQSSNYMSYDVFIIIFTMSIISAFTQIACNGCDRWFRLSVLAAHR